MEYEPAIIVEASGSADQVSAATLTDAPTTIDSWLRADHHRLRALTLKVTGAPRRRSRERRHEPARPVDRKVRRRGFIK
jgi:hypothetical protein